MPMCAGCTKVKGCFSGESIENAIANGPTCEDWCESECNSLNNCCGGPMEMPMCAGCTNVAGCFADEIDVGFLGWWNDWVESYLQPSSDSEEADDEDCADWCKGECDAKSNCCGGSEEMPECAGCTNVPGCFAAAECTDDFESIGGLVASLGLVTSCEDVKNIHGCFLAGDACCATCSESIE